MDLAGLAGQIQTPAYVFSADQFAQRCALVADTFGKDVSVCYSIKANPFLLSVLPDVFRHIEVCSPGELTICEKLHADMGSIIFSGVNKSEADIDRAIADGVRIFTAESPLHFEMLKNCSARAKTHIEVLLRLTGGSQLGMGKEDFIRLAAEHKTLENIDISGIHFFTVTQKRKAEQIIKELDMLQSFIAEVKEKTGLALRKLEYGTGLAVDYFSADRMEKEAERLRAVAPRLGEMARSIDVTVEMGRFFAAPCGHYFTSIADVKRSDANYIICDGGMNHLHYDGQIQGMMIPPVTHVPKSGQAEAAEESAWVVCGSLCTSADVLTRNLKLKDPVPGDVLVFSHAGAYSVMEGMALFLSRELPAVYIYSEADGLKQVRGIMPADVFNTPVQYL